MNVLAGKTSHIDFEAVSALSDDEKRQAAICLAVDQKPRGAEACILTKKIIIERGGNRWLSGFVISYLRKGWTIEDFPDAVPLVADIYRATDAGCVIDTSDHDCVLYEPLDDLPAGEIALAMNELHAMGVAEPWDWKLVEQRLFNKGLLSGGRA